MYEKHITTAATGQMYEKTASGKYYRIYEVENGRYIDPDKYVPYLEWGGTPEVVNVDPIDPIDTPHGLSTEDRLSALEQAVLELAEVVL